MQKKSDKPPAKAESYSNKQLAEIFEKYSIMLPAFRTRELMNLFNETSPEALRWSGLSADNTGPIALMRLKGLIPANKVQLQQAHSAFSMFVDKMEQIAETFIPTLAVKRCSATINIDGRMDEQDWQSAEQITIPYCFRPWKNRGGEPSSVRLLWDDKYLYAAFSIIDTDVVAKTFERDDESFLWDAAEIFILGNTNIGVYWEICATPSGGVTDRWFYKYPTKWFGHFTTERNINGLERAAKISGTLNKSEDTDEGYTMEIAIPFNEIPSFIMPPTTGSKFFILLAVSDLTGTPDISNVEYYSHVLMPFGFQDIWSFSPVILK